MQQSCMIMSLVPLFLSGELKKSIICMRTKKNHSRVIVPSEAIPSDRNNCTATITRSFNIITVFLLFCRGEHEFEASQMLVFRADSQKYQSSLLLLFPWKKCPPTICRDQYLRELRKRRTSVLYQRKKCIYFNASPYY